MDDEKAVQPVPGVVEALARLTAVVHRVSIVSARPVAFLADRLRDVGPLTLHGLYGLETQRPGGPVEVEPGALPWAPVIAEVTERARRELPSVIRIEYKRLAVGLHYRAAPWLQADVERWGEAEAARLGLAVQRGRMVLELKAPVKRDKGDVIRTETGDLTTAWYFGDDLADLEAFRALTEREAETDGFEGVRVAVTNPETGAALAAEADHILNEPAEVPAFLATLF